MGVRWSGEPLQPGQRLAIGQALALDAGVLELTFDLGARVVVQAPAVVKLESPASLRLEKGKLSAEITDVRAAASAWIRRKRRLSTRAPNSASR